MGLEEGRPLLEEKGHEAHSVTLTGMGERVHLASKEVGIETAIQDALNVIRYNDLDDFVLVGHSFAGKVVAAVADHVPEKVRTLLNLDAFRPAKVGTLQGGRIQPRRVPHRRGVGQCEPVVYPSNPALPFPEDINRTLSLMSQP